MKWVNYTNLTMIVSPRKSCRISMVAGFNVATVSKVRRVFDRVDSRQTRVVI